MVNGLQVATVPLAPWCQSPHAAPLAPRSGAGPALVRSQRHTAEGVGWHFHAPFHYLRLYLPAIFLPDSLPPDLHGPRDKEFGWS